VIAERIRPADSEVKRHERRREWPIDAANLVWPTPQFMDEFAGQNPETIAVKGLGKQIVTREEDVIHMDLKVLGAQGNCYGLVENHNDEKRDDDGDSPKR